VPVGDTVVNLVRHSSFCCCAGTFGTATVSERTRKQDLSTDRGDAVHAPDLCICDLTIIIPGVCVLCAFQARQLYVCNA